MTPGGLPAAFLHCPSIAAGSPRPSGLSPDSAEPLLATSRLFPWLIYKTVVDDCSDSSGAPVAIRRDDAPCINPETIACQALDGSGVRHRCEHAPNILAPCGDQVVQRTGSFFVAA